LHRLLLQERKALQLKHSGAYMVTVPLFATRNIVCTTVRNIVTPNCTMLHQVAEEETAALLEAQQDVRRAMQSVQSSRRLDEQQQEQQEQHLAEAEARLKKLRLLVQGPSVPQVQSMCHHCQLSKAAARHCILCKKSSSPAVSTTAHRIDANTADA